VDLADGRTIIVPLTWYPRLLSATMEQRSREGMPKGYHTRTFYDIPAGKSYTQDLLQPGGPCSGANFSGDWGDPFAMTAQVNAAAAKKPPKDLGPGTVNGMAAKVMEVPWRACRRRLRCGWRASTGWS
jgi:hypothetical protein